MTDVTSILESLQAKGIQLWTDGEHLRYRAPAGSLESADLDQIRAHKRQLIDALGIPSADAFDTALPGPRPSVLPLSFGQERLWVTEQLSGQSAAYNSCGGFRLRGPLDIEALRRTLQRIVDRHEALRTVIRATDGKPEQIILPRLTQELRILQAQAANAEAELRQIGLEQARAPFSLEQGPLLRTTLVRLDSQLHVLFVTAHHIVSDAWSMGRFAGELLTLYAAFSNGRPDPLPPLPMQYADYACWQRASLRGEGLDRQLAYWRKELEAAPAQLDLPVDRLLRSAAGALWPMTLPHELAAAIVELSAREGSTPFMTLLAAYQLLLYRLCGQDDLCVGVPIANRNRLGTEPLIGFFLNTLILRVQVSTQLTFRQLLAQVRRRALGAFEHQDLPVDMLLSEIDARRVGGFGAYRQACFTLQSETPAAQGFSRLMSSAELELEPVTIDTGTCKSDLLLALSHAGDGLRGYWEYSTERFDPETIHCFAHNYVRLLEQIVRNPDTSLDEFVLSVAPVQHETLSGAAAPRAALSRAQRLQWAKLDAGDRTFEPHLVCVEIDGWVDVDRLRAAIAHVTDSSQALVSDRQIDGSELPLEVVDFSSWDDPDAAALHWMESQRRTRISADEPRRVSHALIRISPERTLWSLRAHPLWLDEHALISIARACANIYSLGVTGAPAAGVDAQLFKDQRRAELAYRCSREYARERAAWVRHTPRAVSLACIESTGVDDAGVISGSSLRRSIQAIANTARIQQCDVKTLLLGATTLYMWRVAALRDPALEEVLVGLTCSGRTVAGAADLIGCFGGVAALRTLMDPRQTVSDYLRRLGQRLGDAERLGFFGEDDARRALRLPPEQPIFGVLVQYQIADELDFGGIRGRSRSFGSGSLNDMRIHWRHDTQRELVEILIEGNASRYERWELDAHEHSLAEFLDIVAQSLHCPLGDLPLASTQARARLLSLGSGERRPNEAGASVVQRILTTARERPDALAVISGEDTLTYARLDAWSARVAEHLLRLDLGTNSLVAVHGQSSCEVLAALFGVWRAGHAYVAIDPTLPAERIDMLIEDSEAVAILSSAPRELRGVAVRVHELSSIIANAATSAAFPEERVPHDPEALAYCIYTSGSSGKPKAVQVRHAGVANHSLFACREFALRSSDRVLQFASLSFDASVEEIFPTWIAGATVVVRGPAIPSARDFSDLLIRERITVVDLPTAYWQQWIAAADPGVLTSTRVRLVVVGGERVSIEAFRRWSELTGSAGIEWLNTYGPTESTVISTSYRAHEHSVELANVPIGRPISNTQVYVLDEQRRPVPIGITGEIYIGGVGVARGYLKREELTRERFLSDPFAEQAGARMYRTGDLGRWRADGELEYQGRNDQQVKLRGFRIELGEIEARLMAHAGIAEAVVSVREEAPGEKRLVAYYTSRGAQISAEELRTHAKRALPEYMVPAAYVELESLPLTPNGKLDRKKLPAPDASAMVSRQYEPPQGETEHALAGMWCELLRIERVGREDNFFELGGHSLLAVQLISRVNRLFKAEFALKTLFEIPTLRGFSRTLDERRDLHGGERANLAPGRTRMTI